ncbi:hypothetical protein [Streptomyces abyssomicinicus]|uniref:hypothetical protein n=1 Tax=Streptomyces abyssomicinicus TaxID=574929 RepID=UPI00158243A0|nr:hypothetical protein [Streptomyces abyssomicinicus]
MDRPVTDEEPTAQEWRRQHYELWQWHGRPPGEELRRRLRHSNVLGLLDYDSDLVHDLHAAGPATQRSVASLAARRACEAAGLTEVPWVARALTALAEGRPPGAPFDDEALMWQRLRSDPAVPSRAVAKGVPPARTPYFPPPPEPTGWEWIPEAGLSDDVQEDTTSGRLLGRWVRTAPADGRLAPSASGQVEVLRMTAPAGDPAAPELISQPHFALPTVPAAAEADPLKAAVEAVWHAVNACGEHWPELLEEIRTVVAGSARAAEWTGPR